MLSQEELEKVYQENFPVGISLEAAAERLAAMDADYVDDIREMFCNNLLKTDVLRDYYEQDCILF